MQRTSRTRLGVMAFITAAALGLTACGGDSGATNESGTEAESTQASGSSSGEGATEVTDMAGNTVEMPQNPQSVVATDNRIFTTLANWDIKLSAAPVDLMPENDALESYLSSESMVNLGNHREPNLEGIVEAEPDLVLNGQRFSQHEQNIQALAPEAAFVDTNIDVEGNPIDEQLRDLTTLLGDVFGHQDDAQQLVNDFDAAIQRAEEAYDSEETVAGLITTGGDINYSAPHDGRAIGPLFDVIEMTPALDDSGSTNHQGDDISVEAIAESNPDWMIVLDRDAGTGAEDASSAEELLEESEALEDVTAVEEGNIIYMNPDFYTAEDIQHYTELFNQMADAFEEGSES